MKVAACTDLRDHGCHLGIIQSVFQGIRAGGLGYVGSDFHIDGEPLLHGPLLGSDPDGRDTVDAGDQNPIHSIDYLSLSSKGSLPANPVSTSCQYRIASSPNCQQKYTIRPPFMYGKSQRPLSASLSNTPMSLISWISDIRCETDSTYSTPNLLYPLSGALSRAFWISGFSSLMRFHSWLSSSNSVRSLGRRLCASANVKIRSSSIRTNHGFLGPPLQFTSVFQPTLRLNCCHASCAGGRNCLAEYRILNIPAREHTGNVCASRIRLGLDITVAIQLNLTFENVGVWVMTNRNK